MDPNLQSGVQFISETEDELKCPECGSYKLYQDYKRGEIICNACGLVVEDRIVDPGPDWRGFDAEQKMIREHTGPPVTYTIHDKGLSTMIDTRDYDARGSPLMPESKAQMKRLRKWDKQSKITCQVESNLFNSLSELDRIAGQLELPRNVREEASMIYRRTVENQLTRRRSIESSTASAIYISCRQFGVPRTLDEVAKVSKRDRKDIGKSYRMIVRGLGIHLPPVNAMDYIPRFASQLDLPGNVEINAMKILKKMIDLGMGSGKGPVGNAAAAIYAACILENIRRTQMEISQITGVTEVTVRNRYKEIVEYLDLDVKGV
jgi:transcription initiation factor TFIIB